MPGMTVRPAASTTLVPAPLSAIASRAEPVKAMRPSRMAIALTTVLESSTV
jgi:hypothetical protein